MHALLPFVFSSVDNESYSHEDRGSDKENKRSEASVVQTDVTSAALMK